MTLTAESTELSPGESTQLTANISLACGTLEEQRVDFSIGGQGVVSPTNKLTDTAGNAVTTFTAGEEEGVSTVTANSTVSWYPSKVTLTLTGKELEPPEESLRTESISKTIDISVVEEVETWEGTLRITNDGVDSYHNLQVSADISIDFTFFLSDEYYHEDESGYPIWYAISPIEGHAKQIITFTEVNESCCDCYHIANIYAPTELELEKIYIECWKDSADQEEMFFGMIVEDFSSEEVEGKFWYVLQEYEFCQNLDGFEQKRYCDLFGSGTKNNWSTEVYLREGTQEYTADTRYMGLVVVPSDDTVSLTLNKLE